MKEIQFDNSLFSYKDLDALYSRVISKDFSLPSVSANDLERKLINGLYKLIEQIL
jgi:hypothetical protein